MATDSAAATADAFAAACGGGGSLPHLVLCRIRPAALARAPGPGRFARLAGR